jgi:hypothetical protein
VTSSSKIIRGPFRGHLHSALTSRNPERSRNRQVRRYVLDSERLRRDGRLSFTPRRSLVRSQYRPPRHGHGASRSRRAPRYQSPDATEAPAPDTRAPLPPASQAYPPAATAARAAPVGGHVYRHRHDPHTAAADSDLAAGFPEVSPPGRRGERGRAEMVPAVRRSLRPIITAGNSIPVPRRPELVRRGARR